MNTTPATLLERLRLPQDQAAWDRFVELYTPLLCRMARRLGVPRADEDDLVQDVFVVLLRKLPEFHYDPQRRFRGWLWTVLLNKWRERGRQQEIQTAAVAGRNEPAAPDIAEVLSEEEYRQYVTQRALHLMRAAFEPATWQAFWECVVAERPAAEVAEQLKLSVNAVYLAKGRVLRHLRQELAGLLD